MHWGVGVWKEPASCLLGIIGAFLSLTAEAAWVLGEEHPVLGQPVIAQGECVPLYAAQRTEGLCDANTLSQLYHPGQVSHV